MGRLATRRLRPAAVLLAGALALFGQPPATFRTAAAEAAQARKANRVEDAIRLYRKAVAIRPGWTEGWWYLGTLLYEKDAYDEAARAFQRAILLDQRSGDPMVMLGLSEARLGRKASALEHIRQGRQQGGAGDPALFKVAVYTEGVLWLERGAYEKARETLGGLCRLGLENPELIVALGAAVLGSPSIDASEMIRQAGWAEHYAARADVRQAREEYSRLVERFPKGRNVQFAYGRFLLEQLENDKAVEAFQRELENDPKHLLARLGIAGIKAGTDPAAGLPYAEQAVKLAPRLGEAHYLLGLLLLNTDQTQRALQALEIARRLQPRDAKVHFALGRAYAALGRHADAARARAAFAKLNQEKQGEP